MKGDEYNMDIKNYKPRIIDNMIDEYLKTFGAVCIEGPKWCGKTWTSIYHSTSSIMIGDPTGNFQNKRLAETAPNIVLEGEKPRLIDEWQEVPRLWDAIRYEVDKLSKKSINWAYEYEELISNVNSMLKLINTFSYFRFFNSWRSNIMELTSDSIALNFFILSYNDWVRKGKPIGSDSKARQFEKNCLILWDKLIYEYMSSQWKGSADSKIASNISAFNNSNDQIICPVQTEQWIQLLKEIRDKHSVFGNKINSKTNFKALLYHFYCLKKISGPDTGCSIEIDHILPQDLFKNSTIADNEAKMNSLFNLGLLPKNDNRNNEIAVSTDDIKDGITINKDFDLVVDATNFESVNFGLLAGTNEGSITNATITYNAKELKEMRDDIIGQNNTYREYDNVSSRNSAFMRVIANTSSVRGYMGGLVGVNEGYITNINDMEKFFSEDMEKVRLF